MTTPTVTVSAPAPPSCRNLTCHQVIYRPFFVPFWMPLQLSFLQEELCVEESTGPRCVPAQRRGVTAPGYRRRFWKLSSPFHSTFLSVLSVFLFRSQTLVVIFLTEFILNCSLAFNYALNIKRKINKHSSEFVWSSIVNQNTSHLILLSSPQWLIPFSWQVWTV